MSGSRLVGALALGATLVLAPLGARATDFVLWWEKGFYPEEDKAIRQIVADFEQKTGKTVELIQHPQLDMPAEVAAAVQRGATPDFVFGSALNNSYRKLAYEDRLVDLQGAVGPLVELFDEDRLQIATMYNARIGRRALYALPIGRYSYHVHVWRSLLRQAGFKLEDIPKDWDGFWSFWCDRVQPAVRTALGREDIWGVGLSVSADAGDTSLGIEQFMAAYGTNWMPPDNRFERDDPDRRARMIQALDAYTAIYKKGCTPPDAVGWTDIDNNKAFLAQRVVITLNSSLSVPNALKETRPDDYYKNTWTAEWPRMVDGRPLALTGGGIYAVVPKAGLHPETALEFVRFLVQDMALADYLVAAHQRYLPPMRKLLESPFWLDTSDPHFMRSAIQVLAQPRMTPPINNENMWRTSRVFDEHVWPRAVHRVAAEGWSAEQAVDEALARMAEIWALPAPE